MILDGNAARTGDRAQGSSPLDEEACFRSEDFGASVIDRLPSKTAGAGP